MTSAFPHSLTIPITAETIFFFFNAKINSTQTLKIQNKHPNPFCFPKENRYISHAKRNKMNTLFNNVEFSQISPHNYHAMNQILLLYINLTGLFITLCGRQLGQGKCLESERSTSRIFALSFISNVA